MMQEETWPGEGRSGARWRRRKPQRGRNSRSAIESSTTEEAEIGGCRGVASCHRGLAREEREGRMMGWGCQQRKKEKIRLGF